VRGKMFGEHRKHGARSASAAEGQDRGTRCQDTALARRYSMIGRPANVPALATYKRIGSARSTASMAAQSVLRIIPLTPAATKALRAPLT
jgi:hypothetical protein